MVQRYATKSPFLWFFLLPRTSITRTRLTSLTAPTYLKYRLNTCLWITTILSPYLEHITVVWIGYSRIVPAIFKKMNATIAAMPISNGDDFWLSSAIEYKYRWPTSNPKDIKGPKNNKHLFLFLGKFFSMVSSAYLFESMAASFAGWSGRPPSTISSLPWILFIVTGIRPLCVGVI